MRLFWSFIKGKKDRFPPPIIEQAQKRIDNIFPLALIPTSSLAEHLFLRVPFLIFPPSRLRPVHFLNFFNPFPSSSSSPAFPGSTGLLLPLPRRLDFASSSPPAFYIPQPHREGDPYIFFFLVFWPSPLQRRATLIPAKPLTFKGSCCSPVNECYGLVGTWSLC